MNVRNKIASTNTFISVHKIFPERASATGRVTGELYLD